MIMTEKPIRIQRKRTKGWRMPENAVYVGRGSKFGNPFKVGEHSLVMHKSGGWPYEIYCDAILVAYPQHAVNLFEHAMKNEPDWYHRTWKAPDVAELKGKNLACWCPLDKPCHADILLKLANEE